MKEYALKQLRNVALLGHSGAGKTSLTEAMLLIAGVISRPGRVEDGNTVSDFDPEEIRRGISISTSVIPVEWRDHKLNILDTPGYTDFVGEVIGALQAVEAAMVLVDATAGVEVGTELVWDCCHRFNVPRFVVISRMDRENADFKRTLEQVRSTFSAKVVPFQVPVGAAADFNGVVDLVKGKAFLGEAGKEAGVPSHLQGEVEELRTQLIEAAAEADDELIMKYLDGEELTTEEIQRGLKIGIRAGNIVPVLAVAGTANRGIHALLDAIVNYVPSPAEAPPKTTTNPVTEETERIGPNPAGPLVAQVFKTTADPYVGRLTFIRVFSGSLESDSRVFNSRAGQEERLGQLYVMRGKEQIPTKHIPTGDIGAVAKLAHTVTGDTLCDRDHPVVMPTPTYPHPLYSVALTPKTQADTAKISLALQRLVEEDPTLEWHQEAATRQLILSGMGDAHVDAAIRRLESKFGVNVIAEVPKVPYRETITRTATAQHRHKKQTGGAGQFAEVHMRVEPLPRDAGFEYVWEVFGGAISSSFQPSIEKGIKQVMQQGVLAGYPVVDVKAAVYDGKEHPVDSKDIAFQIAGREVFKKAVLAAGPVLLEPIMMLKITVPSSQMGDVLGDLNTRRARVLGMDQQGDKSVITAQVPLAEIQRYPTDLRSMTGGRGVYTMEFSHYEEVPAHIAEQIIAQAKKEKEKD